MSEVIFRNAPNNLNVFKALFIRETSKIAKFRQRLVYSLLYYILVISLFSISISGSGFEINQNISLGIHFSAIMLSILLGAKDVFENDFQSGFIDQLKLIGVDNITIYSAITLANCLFLVAIFGLIAPLGLVVLNITEHIQEIFCATITFIISVSFIVYFASVLDLESRGGQFMLSLLVIPMVIPFMLISMLSITGANFLFLNIGLMLFVVYFGSYLGSKVI